jgi:hypothetical protein
MKSIRKDFTSLLCVEGTGRWISQSIFLPSFYACSETNLSMCVCESVRELRINDNARQK